MQPGQIRVFDGLRITTEHVNHLQAAMQSALRDLRTILGPGVHRGFEVLPAGPEAVMVQPGLAIDTAGNRLVCDEPFQVALGLVPQGEARFVCVKYDRVENGAVEGHPTLIWDSCTGIALPAAPAPGDPVVTLARVVKQPDGTWRVDPPIDTTAPAPARAPAAAGATLQILQGITQVTETVADDLRTQLAAALRRHAAGGDLTVPLARRDVALPADPATLGWHAVLSMAFGLPSSGESPVAPLRFHASCTGDATMLTDGIVQHAACTTYRTDGYECRPEIVPDAIGTLSPALVLDDTPDGSPGTLLRALQLRVRVEAAEGGPGFRLTCELRWTGEAGETAARELEARVIESHWEVGVAWKALAVGPG